MELIYAATSIVPDRSLTFTLTVIIAGLGTVLATLALLILIFNTFGKAVSSAQKKAAEKKLAASAKEIKINENEKAENTGVPLPPPIVDSQGVPPEVVAAITAAVYMLDGENAHVTSINRKRRLKPSVNAWTQAAAAENTRPF